jgi:hypothetical protein
MIEIREIDSLDAIIDDLKALHRAHWAETENYRHSEFKPQYELLFKYWGWKMLRIWGVFDDTRMVGHVTMYITTSMHTGETIANEDALYVLPEYRSGYGAQLCRQMLKDLRRDRIAEAWATCKPATRVGSLLRRLGFSHVADTYLIRLGAH